jgi:hypothetical protein
MCLDRAVTDLLLLSSPLEQRGREHNDDMRRKSSALTLLLLPYSPAAKRPNL